MRCSRTRCSTRSASRSDSPRASTASRAIGAPTTACRLPAPGSFPMSWNSAVSSRRSGRSTRVRCRWASTTVCTECRSTVKRCTGLCCGRARIGSQQGIQRTMQPASSSASQTGTSPAPLDSISSSASRASAGQGTGRAGAIRPRLSAVTGDSIRPREAASAPARSPVSGSLALARRPSATSPPWMIRPWSASTYSGRRSRRVKLSSRRCGTAPCAARTVRSTACPIHRAARLTSRRSSSASSYPSCRATGSTCSSSSRSEARPEVRWSASRTSSSRSYGSRTPVCGRSVSQVAASARSDVMSRSPPRASLRSGSSRYAASPNCCHRSPSASTRSGSRRRALPRQASSSAVRAPATRALSPAINRRSSSPTPALSS